MNQTFYYLLNAYDRAVTADSPFAARYAVARKNVLEHVCNLVSSAEHLRLSFESVRKDSERLAWLLQEECVPEGFVGVDADRYDYATQAASDAGRDEPNDADCLEGLRRLIDAAMVAHAAVG